VSTSPEAARVLTLTLPASADIALEAADAALTRGQQEVDRAQMAFANRPAASMGSAKGTFSVTLTSREIAVTLTDRAQEH
jgi:hypothetical protein